MTTLWEHAGRVPVLIQCNDPLGDGLGVARHVQVGRATFSSPVALPVVEWAEEFGHGFFLYFGNLDYEGYAASERVHPAFNAGPGEPSAVFDLYLVDALTAECLADDLIHSGWSLVEYGAAHTARAGQEGPRC
jgi:hypothetical protein